MDTPPPAFPIRELVRRTGVNASTLRAWENRHGLLRPTRTPSGHRLYGLGDVQRVRRVQDFLAQGMSLPDIVARIDRPGESPPTSRAASAQSLPGPAWQSYLAATLEALEAFSTERLDDIYGQACSLYPIDRVTEHLLMPTLEQLGLRWRLRPTGIAEEHFFSAWLRNKLGARMHHVAGVATGPRLIMACLPGETHELGLLIFALGALQRGYRVVYLGANMPLDQLAHVANQADAAGLVLTGRTLADVPGMLAELAILVRATPIPVFVGGGDLARIQEALAGVGAHLLGDQVATGLDRLEARLLGPAHGARRG
jgi:DNA-binding transcriptional MerR regulator